MEMTAKFLRALHQRRAGACDLAQDGGVKTAA